MTEFRTAAAGTAASTRHLGRAVPQPVFLGVSAGMDRLRAQILRLAGSREPVLITGESGSGKSLVARALHEQGPLAQLRRAAIACQAFPETLLEVELFGCTKGAVVGATCDRQSAFERVGDGTLVLENVDMMSLRTQGLLEWVLETGRVRAVGTLGAGTPVRTRVVATSSGIPLPAQRAGRFHADLWSRLSRHVLHVPSLRERQSDIPLLSQMFAAACHPEQRVATFSAEAMHALVSYSWPGNVSQLRHVVERLVASGPAEIRATDLPVGIRPRPRGARASQQPRLTVGEELFVRVQASGESFWSSVYPLFMKREITRRDLRDLIRRGLNATSGNAEDLVRVLNMPGSDRQKFVRFLQKYGCELTAAEDGAEPPSLTAPGR